MLAAVYTIDTNVYSALLSHVRSQWSRTDWLESPDGIGTASCARSCSRQINAPKVSRVDVTALSRSSGWQQSAWTDSDWQSSWLGADVLTKGLGLCFRPRLEPPLHDCIGGRTVRNSARCFSVLLLRWQWGEQEWVESSLSDTGVVCSENLLNRTTIPTTSSVLCPPRAPEREQTQSQHEQLLVCTVRSLVETSIMQFCRLCPLMCRHCEMRPPGCTAPACPPFLPRPRTSPPMFRIPAKSTRGGSYHFSCSM